jgi:hypothetical protein
MGPLPANKTPFNPAIFSLVDDRLWPNSDLEQRHKSYAAYMLRRTVRRLDLQKILWKPMALAAR